MEIFVTSANHRTIVRLLCSDWSKTSADSPLVDRYWISSSLYLAASSQDLLAADKCFVFMYLVEFCVFCFEDLQLFSSLLLAWLRGSIMRMWNGIHLPANKNTHLLQLAGLILMWLQ